MKKRLVSAVLALALLLGSVPAPVFAEDMASGHEAALTAETPETMEIPEPTASRSLLRRPSRRPLRSPLRPRSRQPPRNLP